MTPSERLNAAADLIRDLAAKAKPGPWTLYDRGVCFEIPELPEMHDGLSGFREADARWIAALSPALGPWLEAALRSAAVDAEEVGADPYMIGLAGVILGKEPGSLPTSWREDRQVIEAVTRGEDAP